MNQLPQMSFTNFTKVLLSISSTGLSQSLDQLRLMLAVDDSLQITIYGTSQRVSHHSLVSLARNIVIYAESFLVSLLA